MRKPLLLTCLIFCLLLSGATPIMSADNLRDTSDGSAGEWSIGSWFAVRLPGLIALPAPIYTNIFNDGPDPVESSDQKEEESSEENPEEEDNTGEPTPFDSGGSGTVSGSRE
jgi:hypothetical protein